MITVVIDKGLSGPLPADLIKRAAETTLEHEFGGRARGDLTVRETGDAGIQALNRDYLGHDDPTDVLSFPADEVDPATGVRYLGDVAISIARAAEQARRAGHSLEAEAQLLVVHGVLHLLGHDHADPADKERMWAAQAEILEQLGLAGIIVLET
jgi:probable rRNA maturation factor